MAFNDHDYLEALSNIHAHTIRDPLTRETSLAVCSGVSAGPLSCRICSGNGSITASQVFWEKDM